MTWKLETISDIVNSGTSFHRLDSGLQKPMSLGIHHVATLPYHPDCVNEVFFSANTEVLFNAAISSVGYLIIIANHVFPSTEAMNPSADGLFF